MRIAHVEYEAGVWFGTGDFQGVRATVKATADVEFGENAQEAYAALAEFVNARLIDGARASHPDAVKQLLIGGARINGAPEAEQTTKGKPGRKPKAIENAASDAPKLADTTRMDVGGLDREDQINETADELDDLLGDDAPAEVVTKEAVVEALKELNKKGGKGAILELLKIFGVGSVGQLPESKYAEAKAKAIAMTAKLG